MQYQSEYQGENDGDFQIYDGGNYSQFQQYSEGNNNGDEDFEDEENFSYDDGEFQRDFQEDFDEPKGMTKKGSKVNMNQQNSGYQMKISNNVSSNQSGRTYSNTANSQMNQSRMSQKAIIQNSQPKMRQNFKGNENQDWQYAAKQQSYPTAQQYSQPQYMNYHSQPVQPITGNFNNFKGKIPQNPVTQPAQQQMLPAPMKTMPQPIVQQVPKPPIQLSTRQYHQQLTSKLSDLTRIHQSTPTLSLTPAKYKEPTEKQLCKILLLIKKLAPNCSLDRIFTVLYFSLVLKQPPPMFNVNVQNQRSKGIQMQENEAMKKNSKVQKVPLVTKYNIVIEYFCKIGYSYETCKQHFIDQKIQITKDQYKAILLDIMQKVLKQLTSYLSTNLTSSSLPILTESQEKLAKLQLVKAFKWIPQQEKQVLIEFVKATYKVEGGNLDNVTPQQVKRMYQMLMDEVTRAEVLGQGDLPGQENQIRQQNNSNGKETNHSGKENIKTQFQQGDITVNNPLSKQKPQPIPASQKFKPIKYKKHDYNGVLTPAQQRQIWSQENLIQLIQLFLKYQKPNQVRQQFIQRHPDFENKLSWETIKNRIEKICRQTYRELNQSFSESLAKYGEKPEYAQLKAQRPLPKLPDDRFKFLLRHNKAISARSKLLQFYLNPSSIQTQFEAIKSIRQILNLTPAVEEQYQRAKSRKKGGPDKDKKSDFREGLETFDDDDGEKDIYDSNDEGGQF